MLLAYCVWKTPLPLHWLLHMRNLLHTCGLNHEADTAKYDATLE